MPTMRKRIAPKQRVVKGKPKAIKSKLKSKPRIAPAPIKRFHGTKPPLGGNQPYGAPPPKPLPPPKINLRTKPVRKPKVKSGSGKKKVVRRKKR